jgi:exodeoxyribonuclease V beta subunit
LKPSDFAILVKKNDDCFPLADALHKYGIPTIIYNAENALKAKEINDFIDLLQAFLAPSDTSRWVRVLSGMYFKNTAEQLAEYIASGKVEEDLKKNIQLLSLWEEYSLEAMFQEADNHYKISRTLLEQQNGRRLWVLTRKWLDLAAKLEEEETPAPDMLLARFRRELMPGQCSFSEDECSIQLHDDDEAVKIMSIHKSKGLQFPVVFVYDVSLEITKKRSKLFHAEKECCLDLSLNNDMKDICAAEEISELMRLAYVAVTRAQVMFRGGIKTTRLQRASFVNFVRTNPGLAESTQDWRLSLHKGLQKKGDQKKISTSLPELSFSFEPYGKEKSDFGLKCRTWNNPPLLSGWDRTSFSALTAAASHEQELYFNETADDYEDNEQTANVSANTLFERLAQFPAGARTGNAWHEILAELAFNSSSRHTGACVRETVDRYALVTEQEKTLTDAVAEMLTELFTMPLPGEYGGFPLAEISWNERVNEMEFTVAAHVETALTDICKSLPEYGMKSRAAVLRKASVVSGAMDLVFRRNGRYYLADWKSNRLGMVPEAYAPEQLEEAMRNKYYILQALIYLDMLRRYLRWDKEKYENEFGGIYYFFLRGCSPEVPGRGVWYHKPSWETLERIEKVLAGDDC